MRNRNRSNVLLVEILIAVLFFMLSATVLVRVFVTARNMTVRSGVEASALAEAQNVAETLYAADDVDAALDAMQFFSSHGSWSKDCGDYTLYVVGSVEPMGAGELWSGEVSAFYKLRNPDAVRMEDEELFSLPCARYKGVA
ncbi:MAG: hypothetical protein IJ769_04780 [Clostridia bacterium]|nr:hypothetical protein [Clostridia bacterium]